MADPRTRRTIADDYQAVRAAGGAAAMRRFQNEEACLVLLSVLERLAADPGSFIHEVALKGGILMAGELQSPRASADIDATSGRQRRIERTYESTMISWVDPAVLTSFDEVVRDVARRLQELRLD